MPEFVERVADGRERALDALPLLLVPVIFACMDVTKVQSILTNDGVHLGLSFGTPFSVGTLWQFVSTPMTGVNANPGFPVGTDLRSLAVIPVALLIESVLTAGYFGSIRAHIETGEYDFLANVRAYFVPFFFLTTIPFVAFLPMLTGALAVGSLGDGAAILFVPLIVIFLAVVYLFYATPYLIVLRDTSLLDALRSSYALAVQRGPYLSYFLGFGLFVLVISPFATAFVVNVPVIGLVVGIVGGGLLGLILNVTTMRFVADIDPQSPSLAAWDDAPRKDETTRGDH